MKRIKNNLTVIFFSLSLFSCGQSTNISQKEDIENLSNKLIENLNSKALKSDLSAESIKSLEDWFGKLKKKEQKRLSQEVGAYLGESIIKNYGGTWINTDGNWIIKLSDDNYVFPFAKVSKFVKNGNEDSFYSLFKMIPIVFTLDK